MLNSCRSSDAQLQEQYVRAAVYAEVSEGNRSSPQSYSMNMNTSYALHSSAQSYNMDVNASYGQAISKKPAEQEPDEASTCKQADEKQRVSEDYDYSIVVTGAPRGKITSPGPTTESQYY